MSTPIILPLVMLGIGVVLPSPLSVPLTSSGAGSLGPWLLVLGFTKIAIPSGRVGFLAE